jgi:predicted RNA-binding protein YlqC (UPF0109 family)
MEERIEKVEVFERVNGWQDEKGRVVGRGGRNEARR